MTTEAKTKLEEELKRFAADLNLSDQQKTQLRTAMERAEEKIEEIRSKHPDVSRADVMQKLSAARDEIRGRVEKFFTPDQLKKWDAEMSKAKEFLGTRVRQ